MVHTTRRLRSVGTDDMLHIHMKTTARSARAPRLRIFLEELRRPGGFVVAVAVGLILTWSKRFTTVAPYLPFLVPFVVSLLTRTAARMAARQRDLLLRLPEFRRDPAFIMDRDGVLRASIGETRRLFEAHQVTHIDAFLTGTRGRSATESLLSDGHQNENLPLYSPVTERWYRAQVQSAPGTDDVLVWLDDVTEVVRLEERKDTLRAFTHRLQNELLAHENSSDDDRRLARLILNEGYRAVLLVRVAASGEANGYVYTADGERHGPLFVRAGTDAPILRSRREGRAVWDDVRRWASRSEFEQRYPVLPEVASILGGFVQNFANYHSGDVSIIAFNKGGWLTATDTAVLESAADTAVTAFSLLDLARRADRRFIQSIHGVCAAAEYSDELTGAHIWRVNDYSRHLAAVLGYPESTVADIGTVAAMHDIGKVAIPHLIKLARPLDPAERREMQMHTVYGAQIIERMIRASEGSEPRLELAGQIALHHHQHWNGTGYPGLVNAAGTLLDAPASRDSEVYARLSPPQGDQIPEAALIVSLADKYDALRSYRQYKPAFTHSHVLELLHCDDRTNLSGSDVFGARIYEAFADTHAVFEEIFDRVTVGPDGDSVSQAVP